MASNPSNLSALTQELSSKEDWKDLVSCDGELYDPLFQGDVAFAGTTAEYYGSVTSYHYAQSITLEPQYEPSWATSAADGPYAFEYAISAAQSVVDGPSSHGQRDSWLSVSPSFSPTATSPLVGRGGNGVQVSSNACEDRLSPLRTTTASPFLESFDLPSSYHTASESLFNPYLASSPHAFSGLDVSASQAFASVGTWADLPTEPVPELDREGAIPIPIPQSGSKSFSNTFSPRPWPQELSQRQTRARAITIPQSNHHCPGITQQWAPHVPPLLSVSPEPKRLPQSVPLSRGMSKNEAWRSRNRLTTPSPTSNTFGWVSYQPNLQNKLVPSGTEGNRGRRQRGRVGGLTPEQRSHAALMRHVKSCSNCKRRKERCDPGIPCKSCLDHYKGNLVNYPCRDRLLSDLSNTFLAERLGWHPTSRSLESFIAPNSFNIPTGISYTIPLSFGFGPMLHMPVHALQVLDADALLHEHVIYSWPPNSSSEDTHTHAVLPAVLTREALSNLQEVLDTHLSLLVRHHFRSFPLYCSPLRILREVYVFYRSLPTNTSYSRVLHQALKLLVLVHIGGDLTLPPPSTDPILAQLIDITMSLLEPVMPTPCFIRSQFGSVMPSLALRLMKEVLSSLEQILLNRECHEWPFALATLITVLMTVESIQYHAAKLPYHHSYDTGLSRSKLEHDSKVDDNGVESLLAFYSACFPGCHARLSPDWEGETTPSSSRVGLSGNCGSRPEDKFVENVREAMKRASPGGYLEKKASKENKADEDMGFFFDRLVARLLVMKISYHTSAE